jgi:hypothetical protein
MVLGGKTARVEREKFARGLHLFYAGDAELKAEIDSNAISQEWLNVLAREALSAERVAATDLQLVPAGGTSNADRHAASAIDLVNAVCRKGRDQAGWTLRNLIFENRHGFFRECNQAADVVTRQTCTGSPFKICSDTVPILRRRR